MRNIISFMHVSLDGFVAGPNGEINWVKVDQELFDYVAKRIGETDTALYGRKTYDMMEGYWPNAGKQPNASKHDIEHSRWYGQIHKLVLSKTMKGTALPNTEIISDDIAAHINKIKQGEGSEILLFGSPSATHALMQLGLIDGFWLFLNPTILGKGIPLFADVKEMIRLDLLNTRTFNSGVIELSYLVNRQ
jgi:dihydrofolate reductase